MWLAEGVRVGERAAVVLVGREVEEGVVGRIGWWFVPAM